MFYIDKCGGIHINRGDSANITTFPERLLSDGTAEPITLTGSACIVFTVKSRYNGNVLIKKTLTASDYIGNKLTLDISSDETDTEPYGYDYSFVYMPDSKSNDKAYTYAQGEFEIICSVERAAKAQND